MAGSDRVAVLGGGIAGLTAAHELAGRGFAVTVYELRGEGDRGLGGKARSQYFRVNGVEVPGEHGYRFMPAFYRCLPDYATRGPIERRHGHENQSFWDYMEADRLQPIARRLLEVMPQSLVAMKASEGNARTLLDVLLLMLLDFRRPGPSEWVLPGPTTDTWLAPWARWLRRLGVCFEQGPEHRVTSLEVRDGRITEARRAGAAPIEADWYVLATPIEASRGIAARSPRAAARLRAAGGTGMLSVIATEWNRLPPRPGRGVRTRWRGPAGQPVAPADPPAGDLGQAPGTDQRPALRAAGPGWSCPDAAASSPCLGRRPTRPRASGPMGATWRGCTRTSSAPGAPSRSATV